MVIGNVRQFYWNAIPNKEIDNLHQIPDTGRAISAVDLSTHDSICVLNDIVYGNIILNRIQWQV